MANDPPGDLPGSSSTLSEEGGETILARWRMLLDSSLEIIFRVEPDSLRLLEANRAFETILERDRADWIGRRVSGLVPESDLGLFRDVVERARGGARVGPVDVRAIAADGSLRDLEVTIVPENSAGEVTAVLGIARDVTARHAAERERLELVSRYQELFQNAFDSIHVLDLEGRFIDANVAAETLFGTPREQLLGRLLWDYVAPEAVDGARALFREVVTGNLAQSFTCEIVNGSGARIPVEGSVRPVRRDGRVVWLEATARDVSRRRGLEAQLAHSQRMEAIGTLAGGVAHDFNNMLTGILGFADLARHLLTKDHPAHRHLESIARTGERAASLTRQLLTFARRQRMRREPVDVNSVVSDFSRLLRRLIGEGIDFEVELAEGVPTLLADPAQLDQVLLNLCLNARDAMRTNGRLSIRTTVETTVDLGRVLGFQGAVSAARAELAPDQPFVVLTITDDGAGMTPDVQAKMFEPFFTTKRAGEGTGLGLSLVYGVVKQLGGEIRWKSHPGQGTTFRIEFPAVEGHFQATGEIADKFPIGRGETVLVAEDESAVRELVHSILSANGYQVVAVENGAEALRVVAERERPVDLVITDAIMPRVSGSELRQRLHTVSPRTPVLFITGYASEPILATLPGALPAEVLEKPFTVSALLRKVRAVLERAASPESPKSRRDAFVVVRGRS